MFCYRLSKSKPKVHVRYKAIQCDMPTQELPVTPAKQLSADIIDYTKLSDAIPLSSEPDDVLDISTLFPEPDDVIDLSTFAVEAVYSPENCSDTDSTVTIEPRNSDSYSAYEAPISVVVKLQQGSLVIFNKITYFGLVF